MWGMDGITVRHESENPWLATATGASTTIDDRAASTRFHPYQSFLGGMPVDNESWQSAFLNDSSLKRAGGIIGFGNGTERQSEIPTRSLPQPNDINVIFRLSQDVIGC